MSIQELKAKIPNLFELEGRLNQLGAVHIEDKEVVDTYFNQPQGVVLKITVESAGSFLVRLQEEGGRFKLLERSILKESTEAFSRYLMEHGILCTLRKRRKIYRYRHYGIDLNLIEDLGDFIVLFGDSVDDSEMSHVLGVVSPDFVKVPFSELRTEKL